VQSAREQYLALVSGPDASASYIALYADFLLRNGFMDEGTRWLKKLDQAQPYGLAAATILAKYLHGIGEPDRIKPVVDQYIKRVLERAATEEQKAGVYVAAGLLFTEVEQHQEAERWFRQAMTLVPDKVYSTLASCLLAQGRTRDAVRVCLDAAASGDPMQPAIHVANVLSSGKAAPEDFRLAEPLLKEALRVHPEDGNLLFRVAGVRVVQGSTAEAVDLYEKVLRKNPRQAVVLNNLATLLGELPGRRQEALQHIDQAIALAGEQPALLDTKGMILVEAGRFEEAVKCLKQAASVRSPDPRYTFHLALAYYRSGDLGQAEEEFRRVDPKGLNEQILTDTDRQMLAEMQRRFRP